MATNHPVVYLRSADVGGQEPFTTGWFHGNNVLEDSNGNVTRTRPVFPYPMVARYTGSGGTNDVANFVSYTPPTEPYVSSSWIGARLYAPGYEQWCDVSGGQLVCTGPLLSSHG